MVAYGCHSKTKNLTAKPNTFTAKSNISQQNLMAKPKYWEGGGVII